MTSVVMPWSRQPVTSGQQQMAEDGHRQEFGDPWINASGDDLLERHHDSVLYHRRLAGSLAAMVGGFYRAKSGGAIAARQPFRRMINLR
jgi:hypothetical protein